MELSDLLAPLQTAGNVIDTPGRLLRTLLAGGDVGASLFDPEQGSSGRDVLEHLGLVHHKQDGEGFDASDLAGMGAGLALDPLTWMTGGLGAMGVSKLHNIMEGGRDLGKAATAAEMMMRTPAFAGGVNSLKLAEGVHPSQLHDAYQAIASSDRPDLLKLLKEVKPFNEEHVRELAKLGYHPDDTLAAFSPVTSDLAIPNGRTLSASDLAHELRHAEQQVLQPSWQSEAQRGMTRGGMFESATGYENAPHEIDARAFANQLTGAKGSETLRMPSGNPRMNNADVLKLLGEHKTNEQLLSEAMSKYRQLDSEMESAMYGGQRYSQLVKEQRAVQRHVENLADQFRRDGGAPSHLENHIYNSGYYEPAYFRPDEPNFSLDPAAMDMHPDAQLARYKDWVAKNALARDETGNPLLLHHGTGTEFPLHDAKYFGQGAGGDAMGKGVYLTADEKIAKEYADVAREKLLRERTPYGLEQGGLKLLNQKYDGATLTPEEAMHLFHGVDPERGIIKYTQGIASGSNPTHEIPLNQPLSMGNQRAYLNSNHVHPPGTMDDDVLSLFGDSPTFDDLAGKPIRVELPIKHSAIDAAKAEYAKSLPPIPEGGVVRHEHLVGSKLLPVESNVSSDLPLAQRLIEGLKPHAIADEAENIQSLIEDLKNVANGNRSRANDTTFAKFYGELIRGTGDLNANKILADNGIADALHHTGGNIMGNRAHDVYVAFDPKNVVPAQPTMEQISLLRKLHTRDGVIPFSVLAALGLAGASQGGDQ